MSCLRGGFKDLDQVFTDVEPHLLRVGSRLGPAVGWTLVVFIWPPPGGMAAITPTIAAQTRGCDLIS